MGAQHRKLGVPGEDELSGRGVSYCATCDAAFFKQAPTIIVGGGDSAMEEAMFLSKFASKVNIVHRRDEFRASKIMLERARAIPNIEFLTPYAIEEFSGKDKALTLAQLRNTQDGSIKELEITGAFIAVGHDPQSQLVRGQVDVSEEGYVLTQGKSTLTNLPGVFASGDLVDHTYRQAVTAAGSGCQAALDAEWYLRDTAFPFDVARARRRGLAQSAATGGSAVRATGGRRAVARRGRWPMSRPKSWVQVPGETIVAPALTPVPTSRNAGLRIFSQWPVLPIQPATTEAGVGNPLAMFSPACDQRKPAAADPFGEVGAMRELVMGDQSRWSSPVPTGPVWHSA